MIYGIFYHFYRKNADKTVQEDFMTKSKKITLLVAIAVILALLITAGVTGAANGTVDCPDCANKAR